MPDLKTHFRRYATGCTTGWLTLLATVGLFLPSLIYRTVVWSRNLLFSLGLIRSVHPGVPVISVGNIAAGGTGKTPVVDYLVKRLSERGRKVGIVSRGYGGNFSGKAAIVSDGQALCLDAGQAGDEPVLLARRNPHVSVAVSPKRIDGIRLLIDRCQVDCVVLDDAFQHRAVARDLDIVLLDGRRPAGNGHLLPAGILREPLGSIRRADLAILTRCESVGADCAELPIPMLQSRHEIANQAIGLDGGALDLQGLQNKRIFAFAGIAEPEAFFSELRAAGVNLSGTIAFPDHVVYSGNRLATLVSAAGEVDLLMTTEKDAVKLDPARLPLPCYSVGVQPVFADESALLEIIDQLIAKEKKND